MLRARTRRTSNRGPFRSGLEASIAADLAHREVPVLFEERRVEYHDTKAHKYTPDFELPNGILVEAKGIFDSADRAKHLLIKAQHPDLEIRFVFSRSAARISKTSATTYGCWCKKHGYLYADKLVPPEWLNEPRNPRWKQPSTPTSRPRRLRQR